MSKHVIIINRKSGEAIKLKKRKYKETRTLIIVSVFTICFCVTSFIFGYISNSSGTAVITTAAQQQGKDKLEQKNDKLKQTNGELKSELRQKSLIMKAALGEASTKETINDDQVKGNKTCYLTFDDGPCANTSDILDVLKRENIKATFFVTKKSGYDKLYKRIVNEGHTIGLHTASHDYSKIYKSETNYFNDLQEISDYVYKLTKVRSYCIRFPGGSSNTISQKYNKKLFKNLPLHVLLKGYNYFDWNCANGDADGSSRTDGYYVRHLLEQADGDAMCVLMHDMVSGRNGAKIVSESIKGLRKKGYTFDKLTETSPGFRHK